MQNTGQSRALTPSRRAIIASWALQLIAAAIMAQTLFFKFTGAPEARHIFETLGVEPWGRWGAGVTELLAVALLLIPRTAAMGAMLTIGIMVGALGAHLGPLGVEVLDDGGTLFVLALITLGAASGVAWIRRSALLDLARRATNRRER